MNCIICNQEIENDSQFINGNWYHNKCIENLQQENEKLKEENEKLNKICMRIELPTHEHFSTINGTEIISRFCDETIVYKSRIDKAIEYIKENYPTSTINYQDDKYKLINILNGSDEND